MSVKWTQVKLAHARSRASGVSLESLGLENMYQILADRAKVAQNHDAPKAVSATLSVLKWSGAIFRPRISKVSVQKNLLCPFHCRPRPSGVNLESLGLEYVPEVSGNRAEVGQNHDARQTVSTTLSVLNWSGAMFRLRNPKGSVEKVLLSPFQCKPRQSGVTLESPVAENIPHFPGNRAKVGQNHDGRKAVSAILSFLKWTRTKFGTRS